MTRAILHVLNGHATLPAFEQSGIPGTAMVYADALQEGPVPAGLSDEEMRQVRARFWGADDLSDWDRDLLAFARFDEVVLWFEHDLFDQLLLIRHLDWFARRERGATALSLICIGDYPGMDHFAGLGQLAAADLAALFERREPVTEQQLTVARRAWHAFTAADPRAIEHLLAGDTSPLPFLAPALGRWLQEFPAAHNGLPRTEREILAILAGAPHSPRQLFAALHRGEREMYTTDTALRSRLDAMASASPPLIDMRLADDGRRPLLPDGTVTLTDAGRAVLAGRRDWLEMVPLDRWLGGVHLTRDASWRWDVDAGRLVTGRPE